MIEKITLVDRIEMNANATIGIRLALMIVDDGAEISRRYHRTVIEPGTPVSEQMALVNDHLSQMNQSAVSAQDIARIEQVAVVVHTEDVIAAFVAVRAASVNA